MREKSYRPSGNPAWAIGTDAEATRESSTLQAAARRGAGGTGRGPGRPRKTRETLLTALGRTLDVLLQVSWSLSAHQLLMAQQQLRALLSPARICDEASSSDRIL
jgi:hypothetical protein